MARASRYRAACAGLVLGLALSACALLPEERGKAPVGANLERLASGPEGQPGGVAARARGRLSARSADGQPVRGRPADRADREQGRVRGTPIALGASFPVLPTAQARP